MPFQPAPGAEPIPGYTLVERLGTGGYGEVWKTTAPGGLTKALKIVYGNLGGHQAEQELKALGRIKEVRHPFLLSLERFEIVSDQLVIITELADKSMLDRFVECRRAGLVGIPRAELLGYVRDAAEALDYMTDIHGLQHLDVKPQNLLLVGGRIKVADFGLVKDMVGTSVTATGGVTPIYATPEAFDGRVSRFSDQYSLAVVYQEMLTGVRPYPGTTVMQLAAQHMNGRPLLDPLPPRDRLTIARALSKVPEQRFPSSLEMVRSLTPDRAPPVVLEPPAGAEGSPSGTAEAPDALALTDVGRSIGNMGGEVRTQLTPLPTQKVQRGSKPGISAETPLPLDTLGEAASETGLRPTLFLGVGGLAGAALRRLRGRFHQRFGDMGSTPCLRLLLLDTDRADLRAARAGLGADALAMDETLLTSLAPVERYRDQAKSLLRWLDRRWFYGIPRSLLTEGLRPLGCLALVANATEVLERLKRELTALASPEARVATARATGLPVRSEGPRVVLVSSVSGGTGGGMLIALAYAVRQVLRELGQPDDSVYGLLAHATSPKPTEREFARVNAFATLTEVHHFTRGDSAYPGIVDRGLKPFHRGEAPFQECYLVHLGDGLSRDEVGAASGALAEYLYIDTATPARVFLDQYRMRSRVVPTGPDGLVTLRGFGLDRISFPRQELIDRATTLLCRRVADRLPGEPHGEQAPAIPTSQEALSDLDSDALSRRFCVAAEAFLGEDPESYFLNIGARPSTGTTPAPAHSLEALLYRIDALFDEGGEGQELSPFEAALAARVPDLAKEVSAAPMEWLVEMVETPGKRLVTAEAAARWLAKQLAVLTAATREKLEGLQGLRESIRQRTSSQETPTKVSRFGWLPGRRSKSREAVAPRFVEYGWARLGELAMQYTLAVLEKVERQVVLFGQDLSVCRQKVTQFAGMFRGGGLAMESAAASRDYPGLTEVLPEKCSTVAEAAAGVLRSMGPEVVSRLEAEFQREVLDQQGGLWGLVEGGSFPQATMRRSPASLAYWNLVGQSGNLTNAWKTELESRARVVVRAALEEVDAAGLFLAMIGEAEDVVASLAEHVKAALPRLTAPGGWQHLLLTLPRTPAGNRLHELIDRVSDLEVTVLESPDDIVFCQEAAHLPLRHVAAALVGDEPHCAELAQKVLTRTDVAWSTLPPPATE